jgi:hypothetical protein
MMKMNLKKINQLAGKYMLGAVIATLTTTSLMAADPYYKDEPQFHTWPDPTAARYEIKRFGPVGFGLELIQPAFTMRVTTVEPGSPAEATGQFKKGQIIESVNGESLKDIDPRVQLGNMITKAEANGGIMKIMLKDDPKGKAREVTVKIPSLGAYSDTWPLNCKKSDKIIRQFADFLGKREKPSHGAALFLLSTGEQKDLDVVTRWFKGKLSPTRAGYPWDIGYAGLAVCEYYLRTGDKTVLPAIESMAAQLTKGIYNGGWAGRGAAPYRYMAGGHLNGAGVHCVTYLMLAKECGVKVDQHTFDTALKQFFRFAGHGNVAYGDGLPESGFVDNGKTGGLAFAMSAAAALTPEGEDSVYAKARDISATKSFYSTSWLFHGHTGGGIGELWRGPAMGLVKEKRPTQYQSFMDERRWMYELARTHDGAFGWISDWNVSYTDTGHKSGRTWGNYIPLVYTLPLKKLRIYGAPKTKFSNLYKLPSRPWGTKADDAFLSLTPGEYAPGKAVDISKEMLRTDASKPLMIRIKDPKASDEMLLMYAHHIDQGIRSSTAGTIAAQGRSHLVLPLLKSKDPRGRHAGLKCIIGVKKGGTLAADKVTDEMFAEVAKMITDPNESWWVAEAAMNAMSKARPELIAPHIDRLEFWLGHEDWWLSNAAITALTPLVADQKHYKRLLPKISDLISKTVMIRELGPISGVIAQLKSASPEIQKFGREVIGQAYVAYPEQLTVPGGQNLTEGTALMLETIAKNLAGIPGGMDKLYTVSKGKFPDESLPHKDLFMAADSQEFGPELKKAFLPIVEKQLIGEYLKTNEKKLAAELSKNNPGRTVDGLVDLYQKLGNEDYNWKHYGPKKTAIKWSYHSYVPSDNALWEGGDRYRKVEWPTNMENWFKPGFNPKSAGWKVGQAPFGSLNGKLEWKGKCHGNFCGCGEHLATLWEKEVLLMRAEIELPPLKKGYAYRLLVGGRSHVNHGGGSDIWIDGDYMSNRRKQDPSITYVGKRQGGKPWGRNISDELRPAFEDGKITLSATGFMRFMNKTKTKGNRQSFWFEEMKLPEVGK